MQQFRNITHRKIFSIKAFASSPFILLKTNKQNQILNRSVTENIKVPDDFDKSNPVYFLSLVVLCWIDFLKSKLKSLSLEASAAPP